MTLMKRKSDASCPLCVRRIRKPVYTSLEDVVLRWIDELNISNDHTYAQWLKSNRMQENAVPHLQFMAQSVPPDC